jgi:L-threonylcarbamoyladenylate synthase
MSEFVAIERDGAAAARAALERCVGTGGVALFPADTVYGLACDPLGADAVERIRALKGREEGKPSELVSSLGPRTREAVAGLLPGPLTLVVHNPERRYPLACSEDPERLGVRLIDGPLSGVMTPLFQTSANRSGGPPPSSFEDVDAAIREGADLAIDGGELGGAPSTVIDLTLLDTGGDWSVLREGAVSTAEVDERLRSLR